MNILLAHFLKMPGDVSNAYCFTKDNIGQKYFCKIVFEDLSVNLLFFTARETEMIWILVIDYITKA